MATLKLYPNGFTAGNPGFNSNPTKRGKNSGWNPQVSRRMTVFLYSVPVESLTGYGYSFTFTVKYCPPTPSSWSRLIDNLSKRLSKLGSIRYHWLTEWQRRGVPHLHGCVYFSSPLPTHDLINCWLSVAKKYAPSFRSQHSRDIDDPIAWSKYLSKHAVRGVKHYQRDSSNIPKIWKGNTGKMWGTGGNWTINDSITFDLDQKSYFRFRRIVKLWRLSKARDKAFFRSEFSFVPEGTDLFKENAIARSNIVLARRMLKKSKNVSQVIGLNEFFSFDDSLRILHHLNSYTDSSISN